MLVLYLLFPRVAGPLWGLPQDAHSGRSGLSDQMTPGNIASLALSSEIAFRVRFAGPVPQRDKLYWRGPVLENYDGLTWRRSSSADAWDADLKSYYNLGCNNPAASCRVILKSA